MSMVPLKSRQAEVSFNDEMLILVDDDDNVTGYDEKFNVHQGAGKLHRAFSIFLFSPCGKVLLQQRSGQKPLWPLYWSNSVCSHPRRGETCELAAVRRLQEELAVSTDLELLYQFRYSARFGTVGSEHELCKVFIGSVDTDYPIRANDNEVADWGWVSIAELEARIASQPQQFTPWLLLEWNKFREDGYSDIMRLIERQRHWSRVIG
jgi:isopentenyl-diphosphate Delta-isomerase